MQSKIMYSTELIKGTLQTIILHLLAENGRMYGYEITQKVKELTKEKIVITEGALYPTLHKLVANGMVVTETESYGKRIRKYYKLTNKGKNGILVKVEEFADFLKTMNTVLNLKLNPQYSR